MIEYEIAGVDEVDNRGTLHVEDTRFHESYIHIMISYPKTEDDEGTEILINVPRGDFIAIAHGVIGSPENPMPEGYDE